MAAIRHQILPTLKCQPSRTQPCPSLPSPLPMLYGLVSPGYTTACFKEHSIQSPWQLSHPCQAHVSTTKHLGLDLRFFFWSFHSFGEAQGTWHTQHSYLSGLLAFILLTILHDSFSCHLTMTTHVHRHAHTNTHTFPPHHDHTYAHAPLPISP